MYLNMTCTSSYFLCTGFEAILYNLHVAIFKSRTSQSNRNSSILILLNTNEFAIKKK